MSELNRNQQTTQNVQKQANLIWNVADILRGLYKPHEYGKVILPMTVIKRLHDTLMPSREKVWAAVEQCKNMNDAMQKRMLEKAAGYSFYNTSEYTFDKLLADHTKYRRKLPKILKWFF